jgi:thioredoxin-related protein
MLQLRVVLHFFVLALALSLAGLGLVEAQPTKHKVELISNWQAVGAMALDNNSPIVLLVETSDCRFCKIVKTEFINPLANSERYKDKVIFSRISLDPGQTITYSDGVITDTNVFCARYEAAFTPTVLFLDGAGKQLSKNLIGMSGRDYYAYYLEQQIEESIKALQHTE